MSKYTKKEFSPHLFHDWTHLFRTCTAEQRSELLLAITDYPNYEPAIEIPIWTFIKSQLANQYQTLESKSQQMQANALKKQKVTEDSKSHPKSPDATQCSQIETGIQTGTRTESEIKIKTGTEHTAADIIKQAANALSVNKANDSVLVDSSFSLFDYPVFKPYIESVTPEIIESVENWLRTAKNGQHVTIGFITRQFTNFANRQNKPIFKK